MNQTSSIPIYQYIEVVWRRKWWLIIPFVVVTSGTIIYVLLLPNIYRSTTLILVEPQKIPQDYVKSVVTGDIQSRLNTIRQQILSRTLLKKIIDEFGLYKDKMESGKFLLDDVIKLIRDNIEIRVEGNNEGNKRNIEAFRVSFTDHDPGTAMLVTNKLSSFFIEENLKIREELVEGASEFLDSELKRLKTTLEKQEEEIADFKYRYMGELPQQLEANLRTLDRLQLELTSTRQSLNISEERKNLLDARLRNELVRKNRRDSLDGLLNERGRADIPSISPTSPLRSRLMGLRERLAELRREYKEEYPDIILLRKEIKRIEDSLRTEEGLKKEDEREDEEVVSEEAVSSDKGLLDDPAVEEIKTQLRNIGMDIRNLRRKERELTRQIKAYEERVENTPQKEQELMILMRDYNNTQKNYQSLLDKKLNADISENLERRQKGEKFRIIDPANLPTRPYKPNRLKLIMLGILFGAGVGGGLIFLMETMNPSFKDPDEISETTSLPLLAMIPVIKELKNGSSLTLSTINSLDPIVLEQYRILFMKITELRDRDPYKVIGITSSVKDEGKTLTSLILGTVISGFDKKVLIIEGDLKNPNIEGYLETDIKAGLADFLSGKVKTDIIKTVSENLYLIAAGNIYKDSSILLSSKKMRYLIETLKNRFDYIIMDLPPILHLADVNMSLPLLEGIILVIRDGRYPKDLVLKSIKSIQIDKIIGILLNEADRYPSYYYRYMKR